MQKTLQRWLALVVLTGALVIGGCLPQQASQQSAASPSSPTASPTQAADPPTQTAVLPTDQASKPTEAGLPRLEGKATVAMVIKGATVTIAVDGANAPITAGNFVDLVQRGVYNGLSFHRVVREPQPFVVQGGDPQSKDPSFPAGQLGTGSFIDPQTKQARYIPLEIKPAGKNAKLVYHQTFESAGIQAAPQLKHQRGAVAMARSQFPDSASSQFYITLSDVNFLDGSYAVFGYVTEGMETVDKIQQGDRIQSAKVVSGLENLKPGKTKGEG